MNNFLLFILIGALAGWMGGKLMRGKAFGLAGNIIVGIVGAVLGGWIFTELHILSNTNNTLYLLAAAVFGSVVFLFLVGLVKK